MPVAVQIDPGAARAAGAGAHRIEFRITQQAVTASREWQQNERSTFVVPR